jgi:hypothetical protein
MYRYYPVYKHYPYRSVEQMLGKRGQHQTTGFSTSYGDFQQAKDCFRDCLPGFKAARKFDGSFHEFELKNQGSVLKRWLRAHRYMPVKIGPFSF